MAQRHRSWSAAAVVLALTTAGCAAPPASERVRSAATAPLVSTPWRLTHLDGLELANPAGNNAVGFQLDTQNPRITGFGGCNRMFGGYLLNGEQLRFDQIGATKMACAEGSRMKLEQDYFDMLSRVSSWKINGSSLELLDANGAVLATFAAATPTQ